MFLKTSDERQYYQSVNATPNPVIFHNEQLNIFLVPKIFWNPMEKQILRNGRKEKMRDKMKEEN